MITGYTSFLVQMFQVAGLTTAQISSWIWAISIGLPQRYRTPITIAWSIPGAKLLISSLGGVSYGEAIGAYITCAVLVTLCGLTGNFENLVKRIPMSLAAELLASRSAAKFSSPHSIVLAWCRGCFSPTWSCACHHVMPCSSRG